MSRRGRVLRGVRVLHGAADQGAQPVSVFFSFRADSACYHVGVGECLRPRLAYRRYLSFSVCMCFCLLADVSLDQTRSILPLMCSRCGETVPVWVDKCAPIPFCRSRRERAGRGWPKGRWALRHSRQLSSSTWRAIQQDLRGVHVDGVRCPDDPTAVLPLLLWWAALDGDSRVGSGIASEFCRGVAGFGGDDVWPGATVRGMPTVVHLVDAEVEMAYEKWPSTPLCVRQRRP